MSKNILRRAAFLAAAALILSVFSAARADTLPLGPGGEFAIDTEEGWKYYTPDSDLSDVATTAGYLFQLSDEYVCYVAAGGTSVIITYYATDGNAGLSGRDRLMKCLETGFSPAAAFFDSGFTVTPIRGGFLLDQQKVMFGTPAVMITAYLILDHGIIGISANGSDHDRMAETIDTLLRDVMFLKDNPVV